MEIPPSEKTRAALDELVAPVPCPVCEGARLQPESLAVRVNGLGIADYSTLPIDDSVKKIDEIKLNPREEKIAGLVFEGDPRSSFDPRGRWVGLSDFGSSFGKFVRR
jgi:excinuclease UvrABC ATPase subunit